MSDAPDESYLHLARELPDLAGAGWPDRGEGFLRDNRAAQLRHRPLDRAPRAGGGSSRTCRTRSRCHDEDVATSWRALADHGNVGTPSIFYVLNDTIERDDPQPGERGLAVTIGPGVTVGLMLLGW